MTDQILHGDCIDQLKSLPDASVDSIVTDPPYELGFMGKRWDASGIAYNVDLWREALRVLKPGGHLLAFGGTRTYHRMAVAIEDAGFEIRDSLHWTYGSGFPKSLNVGKAIDKAAGAEREVLDSYERAGRSGGVGGGGGGDVAGDDSLGAEDAARWQGWGTALKPSHEPIVVARKPLAGTVAETVLAHGTGGLNIDACRVGSSGGVHRSAPKKGNEKGYDGWSLNEHRGELVHLNTGRWPANTLLTHSPGCRQTGEAKNEVIPEQSRGTALHTDFMSGGVTPANHATVPLFTCVPGCPVAEIDKQSGESKSQQRTGKRAGKSSERYGAFAGQQEVEMGHSDKGGASRFFTQTEWSELDDLTPFLYVAKPSKRERNAGLQGMPEKRPDDRTDTGMGTFTEKGVQPQQNFHPTVKPVALMRWLCRLVTPPGGVVLDPFTGSGTTLVAAVLEGFDYLGIEQEADYIEIAKARVAHWASMNSAAQPSLPLETGSDGERWNVG